MTTAISEIQPVKAALSAARVGTYEAAAGIIDAATGLADPNSTKALDLYSWNALVSGALLMPLHICEVVVRNAVSEALEAVYGARWPWNTRFELSLRTRDITILGGTSRARGSERQPPAR